MFEKQLASFVKNSGLSYKQNSSSYIFTCPRCSKKEKLYIRKKDGRFVCFYCKDTYRFFGRCEYAFSELLGSEVNSIKKELYGDDFFSKPLPQFLQITWKTEKDDRSFPTPLQSVYWPLETYSLEHPFALPGLTYLKKRGISLALAQEYQIRYWPLYQRVLFPVYHFGYLYGWQGRIIHNKQVLDRTSGKIIQSPRLLSSPHLPKSELVMFEHRLVKGGHIVICEGPVDAIKAHLCGGNIATMGKVISKQQIALIKSYRPSKVYLALDPDAAQETNRLLQEFAEYECYLLYPPPKYKDLGEMTVEEVFEVFKAAPRINKHQMCVYLK